MVPSHEEEEQIAKALYRAFEYNDFSRSTTMLHAYFHTCENRQARVHRRAKGNYV